MPLRQTLDAVVLRAIDVGEADRFCVLFTEERGRIAARARAVRKTTSRMGGSLLPMQRALIDISEQSNGLLITGASQSDHQPVKRATYAAFLEHARGIDLLLSLTEDDEPMPSPGAASRVLRRSTGAQSLTSRASVSAGGGLSVALHCAC